MPRKGHVAKREVAPDPVYQSTLVTKFVNSMMWGGKKSTAQGIFYTAMTNLEAKGGLGPPPPHAAPPGAARPRRGDEEEGRYSPDGGSQQGIRPLPLVDRRCRLSRACTRQNAPHPNTL